MQRINFTVIIPAYKNTELLFYALKSVCMQKFQSKEVIIIDTAKKLENKTLIKNFNKKFLTNYKYFTYSNKFKGGGARNFASLKSKTNYLAFLDEDDFWDKNYLFYIEKLLNKKNYDLLYTQFRLVDQNGKFLKNFKIHSNLNINDVYVYNPGALTSNMIVKKKTFFDLGKFDKKLLGSNDRDFLVKTMLSKYNLKIVKEYLVNRRIHNKQWSNDYFGYLRDNIAFYNKYKKNLILIVRLRFLKKIIVIFFKFCLRFFL
jgi:teichuronic acid biosynthesis glycosyltransferase TuaG